ncbi:ABC transporter permease, partial [Bacteroidales bacterium OttesenSCG-928-M06]|nr:ABC transporter permease [Bacteroidales bacterium OttesenSCG-928-M06]
LISTLVNSQVAAMLVSGMVLMMPVMLLSGMIFPIESMPVILQWFSCIIPARWFISAIKKIMIEGLSITYAIKEVIILLSMAIFITGVSLKKFNYRIEN